MGNSHKSSWNRPISSKKLKCFVQMLVMNKVLVYLATLKRLTSVYS